MKNNIVKIELTKKEAKIISELLERLAIEIDETVLDMAIENSNGTVEKEEKFQEMALKAVAKLP
jgi:hypothetical protein